VLPDTVPPDDFKVAWWGYAFYRVNSSFNEWRRGHITYVDPVSSEMGDRSRVCRLGM